MEVGEQGSRNPHRRPRLLCGQRLDPSRDGCGDEGEAGGRVLMTGFISALTVGKGEDLRPFSKLSDWEKG